MLQVAPAEVRMGCAEGGYLGGGWSCPQGEDALHGQKRTGIELALRGIRVFSFVTKLPTPW